MIIGTKALKEPEWFRDVCRRFPGRLVLGIDARNGRVATDGWLKASAVSATRLCPRQFGERTDRGDHLHRHRHRRNVGGPESRGDGRNAPAVGVPVVASGGVTTATDVAQLAQLGMAGCIIGRSLYEGRLSLPEAISAAQGVLLG